MNMKTPIYRNENLAFDNVTKQFNILINQLKLTILVMCSSTSHVPPRNQNLS